MTIKIRELTIKANIVERNAKREENTTPNSRVEERKYVSPLVRDFFDKDLRKRRER
ncbi:MAG: hypothetical protein IK005_05915 [Paludibacteraceae bacterium]|nr:hypothetical protein [Paludibacteraceae bacterium]